MSTRNLLFFLCGLCGLCVQRDVGLFAQTSPTAAELKAKTERARAGTSPAASTASSATRSSISRPATASAISIARRFPRPPPSRSPSSTSCFKQAADGKVRLDETIRLERAKAVGGSGVLVEMGTPDPLHLRLRNADGDAQRQHRDQPADRSSRDGEYRPAMQGLGLNATKLRRHMMDLAAARRGDENVSTPDELVRLLKVMVRRR